MNLARISAVIVVVAGGLAGLLPAMGADAPPPAVSLAAGPKVPILAWAGVPADAAVERYAELAEAGFSHNFAGAGNADQLQKALDAAHAAGIRQVISLPELKSDPEGTAKRFKDHPGIGGYYLRDEPGAGLYPELGAWAKRIQGVDKANPCYVNLFPTYGTPAQWETPDYATYVDRFIEQVPTPMLSFDHYPVIRPGKDPAGDKLRGDFYQNLEICAAAARKANRPLWAFVLATAHGPYPIAEVSHMRLQAFSNLAYGAQVIQYFTYWTPKSKEWNFHQGPIEADGKRTPTYDRVKQVNAEIQAVRGAFIGGKVVSVGHTGDAIPAGTARYVPAAPVTSLETKDAGAVVSVLENGDRRFLAVVNRDLHKPLKLTVGFDPATAVKVAAKNGTLSPVAAGSHTAAIDPGDILVFAWAREH